jgi:photosystem II stability/assembly factor-like uncharacterized protein
MRCRELLALVATLLAVVLFASGCGTKVAYFSTHVQVVVSKGIAFPDASHAWLMGNAYGRDGWAYEGSAILATSDGGTSWKRQVWAAGNWQPCSVVFSNDRCGWMLGGATPNAPDPNYVLATTDGGATWQKKDTGTSGLDDQLYDIACVGTRRAWAVGGGTGGLLLATTDGGATWRRETFRRALGAVAFADARHGWVVGDGGILGTTDGGRTWRREPSATPYNPGTIVCVNAKDAWALGQARQDPKTERNVVLATTDGGATWKVRYATRAGVWLAMAFADAAHGWIVGYGGLILATTDGGYTWHRQVSGTNLMLTDVAFADAAHGLVVGERTKGDDPEGAEFIGTILLRTSDGGATWTR